MCIISTKYFVGVESFNFTDISKKLGEELGFKMEQVKATQLFFRDKLKIFIPKGQGRQHGYAGGHNHLAFKKLDFASIEKRFLNPESEEDDFISILVNSLQDQPETYYSERFADLQKGIQQIVDSADEIVKQQENEKCKGFDPDVALKLQEYLINMGNDNTISSKVLYAKATVIICGYFFSTGSSYPKLGIVEKRVETPDVQQAKAMLPQLPDDFSVNLMPKIILNGEIINLIDAAQYNNLVLVGASGSGKSCLLTHLAQYFSSARKKVVFIDAGSVNQYNYKAHSFILDRIIGFYPETSVLKKNYNTNLIYDRNKVKMLADFVIIIDNLDKVNEDKIYDVILSIGHLIEQTDARIIVGSAKNYTQLHVLLKRASLAKLNPLDILDGDKKDLYKALAFEKKELLRLPYFLSMFINDNSDSVMFSRLIEKKIDGYSKIDFDLMEQILPDLLHHSKRKSIKSVKTTDIAAFLAVYPQPGYTVDMISAKLEERYVLNAFEEGYIIAKALSNKLVDSESILHFFGEGLHIFSTETIQMLSELLSAELIENLRIDNNPGFYEEKTAMATDALLRILEQSDKPVSYYELNLKNHLLKNIAKKSFYGALISDASFANTSLDSAVFSILPKEDGFYAIGRNIVSSFNLDMTEESTITFGNNTRIGSHPLHSVQTATKIAVITADNNGYVIDKDDNSMFTISDVVSVSRISEREIVFGKVSGQLAIYDTIKNEAKLVKTGMKEPVGIIGKFAGQYIFSCNSTLMKISPKKSESEIIGSLNLLEKSRTGLQLRKSLKIESNKYLLLFYKFGVSVLTEMTIDETEVKKRNIAVYSSEDNRRSSIQYKNKMADAIKNDEHAALAQSVHIDINKITDVSTITIGGERFVVCSLNSGQIHLYPLFNRTLEPVKIDFATYEFGQNIEALAGVGENDMVVALSDRSVQKVHFYFGSESELRWYITKQIKAANIGIRRMLLHNNKLHCANFNSSISILRMEGGGSFVFENKILLGNGVDKPVWSICPANSGVYCSCGSEVYYISENYSVEKVAEFDWKVENITFDKQNNLLYVASGQNVFKLEHEIGSKKPLIINSQHYETRPLALAWDGAHNLFIGTSSDSYDEKSPAVYCKAAGETVANILPPTREPFFTGNESTIDWPLYEKGKKVKMDQRLNPMTGWYRTIEIFGEKHTDGTFTDWMLCSGLKEGDKHYSVLYKMVGGKYILKRFKLVGHNDYVVQAKVFKQCEDVVHIITTSYDGCVNCYALDTTSEKAVVYPVKHIPINEGSHNMYDILCLKDAVFVCSANGKIYKIDTPFETEVVTEVYENTDLFITNCDFSDISDIDEKSEISANIKESLKKQNNIF